MRLNTQTNKQTTARKHKLDDVSVDVAALVANATQSYLKNIIEKLNVVAQHRLDLSMRVCCSCPPRLDST